MAKKPTPKVKESPAEQKKGKEMPMKKKGGKC